MLLMEPPRVPLIGISTLVDYSQPLELLLNKIREAGFEAVAIGHKVSHFPYHDRKRVAEVGELTAGLGLFVDYIHTPIDIFLDMSTPNDYARAATILVYKFAIDAIHELGGRAATAHLCNVQTMSPEEIESRLPFAHRSVRELSDYAGERGIRFCLENLPHPYSYQRLLEKVLEMSLEPTCVCLDTCHVNIHNPAPFAFIEKYAAQVGTTHLSDNFGARDVHLTPYAGAFDFDRLARILADAGYDGNVMLENSLEAAVKRFARQQNVPGEPRPAGLDEYLRESCRAAQRIRDALVSARSREQPTTATG